VISAADELESFSLLPPREAAALATAGFRTAAEILDHLPKRYEDRRRFDLFPNQPTSSAVCLRGAVVDASKRHFGRGGFYEAVVMDGSGGVFGSGKITCRWFNMPFIHKLVATGQELIVYGKVKDANGRLIIDHPEFEILREDETPGESIHLERIVPIYRNIAGIAQRRLREIIHMLLLQCDPATLSTVFEVDSASPRADALRTVHFPDSLEMAHAARRRFALEEFFTIQLNVAWRRSRHQEQTGRVLGKRTALLTAFYNSLPFDLTEAQKRSIREIIGDMRLPRPMNRLLQGDVGSGKTFVAMAAMLLAADSGCQAALMAPTQILAEQHSGAGWNLWACAWPCAPATAMKPATSNSPAVPR
jgi:ATP-dependent DNA helicase RecG